MTQAMSAKKLCLKQTLRKSIYMIEAMFMVNSHQNRYLYWRRQEVLHNADTITIGSEVLRGANKTFFI